MKRLIASFVALSIVAAPALAATTPAAPGKVTKQVKKSRVAANSKNSKAPAKKNATQKKNG
jgi:Ni/Co efflux regulator RcnB